jgi:hypothetical protein
MKLGRIGYDFELRDPSAMQLDGPTVQFSGWVLTTPDKAPIARDQFAGLMEAGEPTPIVCPWDESLTGFYEVTDASTTADPNHWERGRFEWSVTAERLASYPMLESLLHGGLRPSAETVFSSHTDKTYEWHAVPTTAFTESAAKRETLHYPSGVTATANAVLREVRQGPGGRIYRFFSDNDPSFGSSTYDSPVTWTVPPGRFYDMSVTVESYGAVQTRRDSMLDPFNWSMQNGLVWLRPVDNDNGDPTFDISAAKSSDGTLWGEPVRFTVSGWADDTGDFGLDLGTIQHAQLVSSKSTEAVVKLAMYHAGTRGFRRDLYVVMRRGGLGVDIAWSGRDARYVAVQLDAAVEEFTTTFGKAITPIPLGVRHSSPNATGNRGVIACSDVDWVLGSTSGDFLVTGSTVNQVEFRLAVTSSTSNDDVREAVSFYVPAHETLRVIT